MNNLKHILPLDGFILLDKISGITSNAALQQLKYQLKVKKAGHTGSLDPLASGMLPICIGEATKFSQYLLDADKEYIVTAQLGSKTTTGDAEGEILETKEVPALTLETISEVLAKFTGAIQQVPSMFSALKHKGQPLYKLARQGIEVERKPRTIQINNLTLINFQNNQLELKIHCSKGTYVRTLVEDIGDLLGCGAYVSALRRTQVGSFTLEQMSTLDEIKQMVQMGSVEGLLISIEQVLHNMPMLQLTKASEFYMSRGQAVNFLDKTMTGSVRLYRHDGQFMGVGEINEPGMVSPKRLILKQ